jgi:hypothetical protein
MKWVLDHIKDYGKEPWGDCDVGTVGQEDRVVDPSVRSCLKMSVKAWIIQDCLLGEAVLDMLQEPTKTMGSLKFSHWEALRYDVGGVFAPHVDRRHSRTHIGTLLLIVAEEGTVGGVLQNGLGEPVFSKVTEPHLVFIPLGYTHSVSPLEAGRRYVLKASVYGPDPASDEDEGHLRMRRSD